MESSKNTISSAAQECIRRFTEEMLRISAREKQFEDSKSMNNEAVKFSHVVDRATQTDPVMITTPNGISNGNGHTNGHTNDRKPLISYSSPSSQSLPIDAQDGPLSDHANKKSVLDSVLLQSPKASGVLAPPSTPECRPRLTNNEISQIIIEKIEGLPPSSTLTLSESRHAPRYCSPFTGHETNVRTVSTREYTSSSMPAKQMSQADRVAQEKSLSRMSFQVADSSPATPQSSLALGPITTGDSSVPATTKTSPASVSSKALETPLPDNKWVPPHLRGVGQVVLKTDSKVATAASHSQAEKYKEDGALEENFTGCFNTKPTSQVLNGVTQTAPSPEVTASVPPPLTPPPSTFQAVSLPAPLHEDINSSALVVTPSSIIFQAVSPQTPSTASFQTKENREKELYFKAWGKPEARLTPVAKVRKVIIQLPNHPAPTPSLVASLVWGGPIEEIHMKPNSAHVLFASPEDCQSYFDATSKGIKYKHDGRDLYAYVNIGKDVDVVSGILCNYLGQNFSRCVRAIDAPSSFTDQQLRALAELKNRKVEGIERGTIKEDLPYVIFRFCNIRHAVEFKTALVRYKEWEHCNIHHVPDPCAQATGVHSEPRGA